VPAYPLARQDWPTAPEGATGIRLSGDLARRPWPSVARASPGPSTPRRLGVAFVLEALAAGEITGGFLGAALQVVGVCGTSSTRRIRRHTRSPLSLGADAVGEHVCWVPSAGKYGLPTRKAGLRLMLMIILIVLVLMFLLGGFGYSRRGRRGV
jgi:hypothetical protein